jgi:imidazolonepropionase-like amidohydrolase
MRTKQTFLFLLAAPVLAAALAAEPAAHPPLALVGGRLYAHPEAVPIDDAAVVAADGRIVAAGPRAKVTVPPEAKVVDCKGLVIAAGFYNSHVHFTDPARWADVGARPAAALAADVHEMLTKYGFTTVVDTASDLGNTNVLRKRILSGEVAGPRILTAGSALYPPQGVPYYVRDEVPAEIVNRLPQPATAPLAREVVSRQADGGADIVKLFTGSWVARGKVLPMPAEIASAAADEAHRRGKVVFSHPSNLAGLQVALDSGVDVLAHAIEDTRGMTPQHYARMKKQNMAIVPTLALFRGRFLWDIEDEIRTYARAGGQILFGTDVGYLPNFDHAIEYELMAGAGLGWREILASLTTSPASRFGEAARRGKVIDGFEADLVVLGSDPAFGVRAFADVRHVVRAGHEISASR